MAIPFYENEEQLSAQQQETDQVDGPIIHAPTNPLNTSNNSNHWESAPAVQQNAVNQQNVMAWKMLALAMCKALKDHYLENMLNTSSTSATTPPTESATAVIQILPNGQVKPHWN